MFLSNSFQDIFLTNEGCVLQYKSNYNKIKIQCRRVNKDWNDISESSTPTNNLAYATEVNDLNVNKSYEFRGLFEDTTNGDIVQLNSKESIKIKSKQHLF